MSFQKTFYEIKLPNKDIKLVITYAHKCTAHFTYCYNSISETYMGLSIDTFVSSMRGLTRVCPEFLDISEHYYERDLLKMGFERVEADAESVKLTMYLSQAQPIL